MIIAYLYKRAISSNDIKKQFFLKFYLKRGLNQISVECTDWSISLCLAVHKTNLATALQITFCWLQMGKPNDNIHTEIMTLPVVASPN